MVADKLDALVFIGRFQPFHQSHLETVLRALELAQTVVLVIGSDKRPRTVKNPFSTAERIQMIQTTLGQIDPSALQRVLFVPVRDYFNGPRWAEAVQFGVDRILPAGLKVGLIGHDKDQSTAYLQDFPTWQRVPLENFHGLNASDIRQYWFEHSQEPESGLSPAVVKAMRGFRETTDFEALQSEFVYLEGYRASWKTAPFPPVFVTVDALVQCQNSVLLIQRGGFPGKGQWATPGGFLDQNERIINAAWRELQEETGLELDPAQAAELLVSQAYFDHPDRSARGRTVTHVFHFNLGDRPFPEIQAADDAAHAQWVPIEQLPSMESQFFEDHFVIVEHFLGVQRMD